MEHLPVVGKKPKALLQNAPVLLGMVSLQTGKIQTWISHGGCALFPLFPPSPQGVHWHLPRCMSCSGKWVLDLGRTLVRTFPGCSKLVSLCCRLSFALYSSLDIIPSIADANTEWHGAVHQGTRWQRARACPDGEAPAAQESPAQQAPPWLGKPSQILQPDSSSGSQQG